MPTTLIAIHCTRKTPLSLGEASIRLLVYPGRVKLVSWCRDGRRCHRRKSTRRHRPRSGESITPRRLCQGSGRYPVFVFSFATRNSACCKGTMPTRMIVIRVHPLTLVRFGLTTPCCQGYECRLSARQINRYLENETRTWSIRRRRS